MYPIRSFFALFLIFFSLSLLGEFVVGPLMGDDIPFWKIAAVSLITTLSTIIPLQKRKLSPGDIFKYFKRSYIIPQFTVDKVFPAVREAFPESNFSVQLNSSENKLRIKRKSSWQTFGEIASLEKQKDEVILQIRPRFYLDVFDQGQAHETLLKLENILNTPRNE